MWLFVVPIEILKESENAHLSPFYIPTFLTLKGKPNMIILSYIHMTVKDKFAL